ENRILNRFDRDRGNSCFCRRRHRELHRPPPCRVHPHGCRTPRPDHLALPQRSPQPAPGHGVPLASRSGHGGDRHPQRDAGRPV
ncbi:MAG: hypothetical protein AVDCRST_MAG83-2671, partial [uncultured Arthrobacter sp.]